MNNDEVEKNILEAIEILGKTIYASHKILEDRISNIVNLLTLKENEEKPEPKTYPDDQIVAEPMTKIPLSYKVSKTDCKYCGKTIAWPRKFVTDAEVAKGAVREPSIHCDMDGNVIGLGRCPNL